MVVDLPVAVSCTGNLEVHSFSHSAIHFIFESNSCQMVKNILKSMSTALERVMQGAT